MPNPTTHEQANALFDKFIRGELGAATQGRLQGHLLGCADCSTHLTATIDQALERGDLPPVSIPPTPLPDALLLQRLRGTTVVLEHIRQASQRGMENLRALAAEFNEVWNRSTALLRPEVREPAFAPMGGAETVIQHFNSLDDLQEAPATTSTATIEDGPKVTTAGVFEMRVTTDDPQVEGRYVICKLPLVEGRAVQVQAEILRVQTDRSDRQWQATFKGNGLPGRDEELEIDRESIRLLCLPSTGSDILELLAKARSGVTNELFECLWTRRYARTVHYALRFVNDQHTAEDIVMNAFLKSMDNLLAGIASQKLTWRGDVEFVALFQKIWIKKCMDELRRHYRRAAHEETLLDWNQWASPPASHDSGRIAARLREVVGHLARMSELVESKACRELLDETINYFIWEVARCNSEFDDRASGLISEIENVEIEEALDGADLTILVLDPTRWRKFLMERLHLTRAALDQRIKRCREKIDPFADDILPE